MWSDHAENIKKTLVTVRDCKLFVTMYEDSERSNNAEDSIGEEALLVKMLKRKKEICSEERLGRHHEP